MADSRRNPPRCLRRWPYLHALAFMVASLVAAMGVLTATTPASGATAVDNLYVAHYGSDAGGANNCQSAPNPCRTLTQAINESSDGDTIHLASGTYAAGEVIGESIAIAGGPGLAGSVVISGSHSYGDGLTIDDANVVLSNLTITGVHGCSSGVYAYGGADVTLNGVSIIHNAVDCGGGAISLNEATLTMNGGLIARNRAKDSPGGGVYNYDSTATFSGVTFVGNHVGRSKGNNNEGGAIFNDEGTLDITSNNDSNSEFILNVASDDGGAIEDCQSSIESIAPGTVFRANSPNSIGTTDPDNTCASGPIGTPNSIPAAPPLPDKPGCYSFGLTTWSPVACTKYTPNPSYPPPQETLDGVQLKQQSPPSSTVFNSAMVDVTPLNVSATTPACDSVFGCGLPGLTGVVGSLQLNTDPFVGNNGHVDWVQFVYQNFGGGLLYTNDRTCIWQIDLSVPSTPQNGFAGFHADNCFSLPVSDAPFAQPVSMMGNESNGILNLTFEFFASGHFHLEGTAAPDTYGLEGNWNSASGGILGASSSELIFPYPTDILTTTYASPCAFLYAAPCSGGSVFPSPGASVWTSQVTGESNNLTNLYPTVGYINDGDIAGVSYDCFVLPATHGLSANARDRQANPLSLPGGTGTVVGVGPGSPKA
jgi:hypothetical protein